MVGVNDVVKKKRFAGNRSSGGATVFLLDDTAEVLHRKFSPSYIEQRSYDGPHHVTEETVGSDGKYLSLSLIHIWYRVRVEIEYFIALCELPLPQLSGVNPDLFPALRKIYTDFTESDAEKVKSIESVTNHDVKAVEYFIKEKFDELHLEAYKEFIHFGLTSQDINNTSVPLLLKEALHLSLIHIFSFLP